MQPTSLEQQSSIYHLYLWANINGIFLLLQLEFIRAAENLPQYPKVYFTSLVSCMKTHFRHFYLFPICIIARVMSDIEFSLIDYRTSLIRYTR